MEFLYLLQMCSKITDIHEGFLTGDNGGTVTAIGACQLQGLELCTINHRNPF